ncbi:hypothetical protein VN97_g9863 [Penicillium thymicola]|uniref:Uncharacterized protein n=1 Tax=Penicillium thymicola TaxID=293382 RepID=A0AAI9X4M8_PENTH|nr:hypothetical protein VN97_g9863 [Penicillium thymicola]
MGVLFAWCTFLGISSCSQKELWKEVADWEGAGRENIGLKRESTYHEDIGLSTHMLYYMFLFSYLTHKNPDKAVNDILRGTAFPRKKRASEE